VKKIFIILILNTLIFNFSYANNNQDSKKNTPVTDQLKHLQDLYKSGVISGYEYENEKKKLLIK
tara:strand:- start:524 stop:715 length:192 start_codon:yes stop_codon:yes gene_type:complete